MNTFFCRHSSQLDIDGDTLDRLWNENLIGIHYPNQLPGGVMEETRSTNPEDYVKTARKSMNVLAQLASEGGYVFAVYENQGSYKIGKVDPGTSIDLIPGKWGSKNSESGRQAVLKGLRFSQSKILEPSQALALTCAQPRQGTICRWHAVGSRVANLFEGNPSGKQVDNLTPDLLEVMCTEFLRSGIDKRLPVLASLLAPIGRTMKDADILGLTTDGYKVLVQVTYSEDPGWKMDRLKKYTDDVDCKLVMFCQTNENREEDSILIYSIDEAYRKFSDSEIGRTWVSKVI